MNIRKFSSPSTSSIILLAFIALAFSVSVNAKGSAGKLPKSSVTKLFKSRSFSAVRPIIESFSPVRAVKGDTVIITGKNFDNIRSVHFGGSWASFQSLSSTKILAVVGNGATGFAAVGNDDGIDSLAGFTFVPAPSVTKIITSGEGSGMQVIIEGKNFEEVKSVMFGNVAATSFTVKSTTEIIAITGAGETGTVSIITRGGIGKKTGFYFRKPPVISNIEPVSAGAVLTIRGSNFNPTAAGNKVYFGSIAAEIIVGGTDLIQVKVPANAPNERIRVLNTANKLSGFSRQVFRLTYDIETGKPLYPNSTALSFGQKVSDISSADFDADGYHDLAVFLPSAGITILRNSQAPGMSEADVFPERVLLPINETGISYALGDVSGDGLVDIVCVVTDKVIVLRNQSTIGKISFSRDTSIVSIAPDGKSLTIKDMDLDGKCDLFINNKVCRNLSDFDTGNSVLFGKFEAIHFQVPTSLETAIEDFDGDMNPDFLVNKTYGGLLVQQNNFSPGDVTGLLTYSKYYKDLISNFYSPSAISAADLDGDNMPEIIQYDGGSLDIFKNQFTSASPGNFAFSTPYRLNDIYIAYGKPIFSDINGDAKADIIAGNGGVFTNINLGTSSTTGKLQFGANTNLTDAYMSSMIIADLDGNGKPEIIGTSLNSNIVYIFHNNPGSKPAIATFQPDSAGQGQVVKITGFNLSKVSGVKFGDQAASSFQVHSTGLITAVVGSGASGKISLISGSDQSSKDGFVFVPAPVITAFSPATALAGSEVSIFGTNFKNTTLVRFGDVKADSIKSVSPTQIVAIVKTVASGNVSVTTLAGTGTKSGFTFLQSPIVTASGPTTFAEGRSVTLHVQPSNGYTYTWSKDGQQILNATKSYLDVSQAGTYQANVFIGFLKVSSNSIQVKTLLDIFGGNFKLKIVDKSCKSTNNGSISITTQVATEYLATLKGIGIDTSYSFYSSQNISGLKAGNYNLCITVNGSPEFIRCFDVVISEPKEVKLISQVNPEKSTVTLLLSGADVYYYSLNGKNYQTSESNVELPIAEGKNYFRLWTDKPCQGIINRVFATDTVSQIYPQPFEKELTILSKKNSTALITILSPEGRSVYSASHRGGNGAYTVALPEIPPGIYLLKLTYSDSIETFKIIKK